MLSEQNEACSDAGFIKSLNPCFNGICSLRAGRILSKNQCSSIVLILVLMEYALWESLRITSAEGNNCLNPCFNGICSLRAREGGWSHRVRRGLNPCFNGICSLRLWKRKTSSFWAKGLNPCFNGICSLSARACSLSSNGPNVLILVLMEYALWAWRSAVLA